MKWMLRDSCLVLAMLIGLEVTLQIYAPRYRLHLFDADFTGSAPNDVNASGFRGRDIEIMRRTGTARVLALGDSVTFGTGVASEDSWPAILAGKMSRSGVRRCETINSGMPGASLQDLKYALSTKWQLYRPDAIALCVSGNMVALSHIRAGTPARMPTLKRPDSSLERSRVYRFKTAINRMMRKCCVPAFLLVNSERLLYWAGLNDHLIDPRAPYGPLLAHGWRQLDVPPDLAEAAWGQFERDLAELRDAAAETGAILVVTYTPTRFMLSDSWLDNEKNVPLRRIGCDPSERMRLVCARVRLPYVDVSGALKAARRDRSDQRPLYRQCDYTHFDRRGHEVVAGQIAAALARAQDVQAKAR